MDPYAVDLNLALDSYLTNQDGHVRVVHGIQPLAARCIDGSIGVVWMPTDRWPSVVGGAYSPGRRLIILSSWIFDSEPWFIREVWSHELCHALGSKSETSVRNRQRALFPDQTICMPDDAVVGDVLNGDILRAW